MPLGIGTRNPFEISFRDKSDSIGTMRCYALLTDVDGGNYEDNNTAAAAFVAALDAATLGVVARWQYQNEHIVNPVSIPSSASAQRENKLLVRFHDVTTLAKNTFTIPTIDLPNLVFETDAKDFVSKSSPAAIATLVTQIQTFVTSPTDGNLVIVDSLEFVGRNS